MAIASAWFTDHGGWLRQRAVKVLGPEHADDSLQNLFFKVLRRGRLAEVEEPEKYLTRAQSRVFATHWSRRCRVEVPVEDAAVEDADTAGLGEGLERMQDAELVRRCLPLLKARHRAVLELQMSGMGREAIALELGLSPHAVTQLTRRALDALDHKLKQNGYLRGLVPVPLAGWIRDKVRGWVELLGRYGRSLEGLVPMTVVAVVSIIPPSFSGDVRILNFDAAPGVIGEHPMEESAELRSAVRVESPGTSEERASAPERNRSAQLANEGTKIWVDEWDKEREEPPVDEQLKNFLSDPSQALPRCPQTLPCPAG